jgi:hypothetical protein
VWRRNAPYPISISSGSLLIDINFIMYFHFPILKYLIVYVGYCFISVNNRLLVVKCYWSLVVSGFSRTVINLHTYVFIVPTGTLRLPWLRFFTCFLLSCKANARV